MKIVLVFTGGPESPYLPMTAVVAAAARHVEPSVEPTVVVDARSASSGAAGALEDVAEVMPVDVPHADATLASRWLKVRLRSIVEGDFLFLDADALPVTPFLDAIPHTASFAAVPDSTGLRRPGACPRWVQGLFRQIGWPVPSTPYFNSGVMFWRDNDEARLLGRHWAEGWDRTSAGGEPRDQPALHHAIATSSVRAAVLEPSMNTFVEVHPYRVSRARVLHFFVGVPGRERTLIDALAEARAQGERLDWPEVEKARRSGSVWHGLSAIAARSAIAERTTRSVWRLLHDGCVDDARWAARHAVRIAPWRPDGYGMVARSLLAREGSRPRTLDKTT